MKWLVGVIAAWSMWTMAGTTVIYPDDTVLEVPSHHEVVIVPQGFNTGTSSYNNLVGAVRNSKGELSWPWYDKLCAPFLPTLGFSPRVEPKSELIIVSGKNYRFINSCIWHSENL